MRTKWIVIAAATLAMGGTLAACNRGDHTPAGEPDKVTIAYSATLDAALAQVAQMQGYYQQEGLAATPQKHAYGKLALDAVLEGKADLATVAETPVMFAIMKGEKISVLATILKSNSNIAIIARKDRGILAPQDLKGRRIAVTPGTILDFYLDSFLATHGLSRKAVTTVNLQPDQMVAAIGNGDVDAISGWTYVALESRQRLGLKGVTFHDKDIYTQSFLVVATQEFIRNNPKKVDKLLRSLVRAEEFTRQNPAQAQAVVADFCRIDKAAVAEMWSMEDFGVTLDQALLLALEDESNWAIKNKLTNAMKVPNYLDHIHLDGLRAVKPDAVSILR